MATLTETPPIAAVPKRRPDWRRRFVRDRALLGLDRRSQIRCERSRSSPSPISRSRVSTIATARRYAAEPRMSSMGERPSKCDATTISAAVSDGCKKSPRGYANIYC